jgi:hypothetical protein
LHGCATVQRKYKVSETFTQDSDIKYDENIVGIANGMSIYVSGFSFSSFPITNRKWVNIAPTHVTTSACAIEDYNFNFLNLPSFSKTNGFYLGTNVIYGPMSYQLGIVANESFTIFFTMKFDTFSKVKPPKPIDLLKLYANTNSNNGINLYITPDYEIDNEIIKINAYLDYGESKYKLNMNSINHTYTYMFFIIKSGQKLNVYMFPNIAELASTSSLKTTILDAEIDVSQDVLLSNKELVINQNKNLLAHLYNFGVYNKALLEFNINDVYAHTQVEIQKNNQMLVDFSTQINDLKRQIQEVGQCPFDSATCNACNDQIDWTNLQSVIASASSECLNNVDTFCKGNSGHPLCTCWNPSNIVSKSDQCKSYRSIFDPSLIQPIFDIHAIRTKYDLCPCVVQQSGPLPVVSVVNKMYANTDKTDMDLYNELQI